MDVTLPPDETKELMKIQDVPSRGRTKFPTKLLQVYVDDICYVATQSEDGSYIPTIRRAAIHGIQSFFPTPTATGHTEEKGPSLKKEIGEGRWGFQLTEGDDWDPV